MDQQEIFAKVKEALIEALDVEDDDVTAQASLTEDLEAESIDFVDIVFRLEKSFGIKIPQGDLFPQDLFSDKQYVQEGKLTGEGISQLKSRYPYIELGEADSDLSVDDLAKKYNVNMLVKYVQHKLSS